MRNADYVMDEISDFLDRSMLKTSKITSDDVVRFIEQKWAEADDEKYKNYFAHIVIGRMINESIARQDERNLQRWIDESDRHISAGQNAAYVTEYYKGECWLRCGNESKALVHFWRCYDAEPEYIFTRSRQCMEFFNKHLETPRELVKINEPTRVRLKISLPIWAKFFGEESGVFALIPIDEYGEELENLDENMQNAVEFLQQNEQKILTNLLTKLLTEYPKMQEIYAYDESKKADFMPDILDISGFANLLTLTEIFLLTNEQGKVQIGFSFNCSWDTEHELGVMTLDGEVLDIGGAERAFCI